jgi:HD-like signal output (HDOD) protein
MKAVNQFVSDIAEEISMPEVYLKIRKLIQNADSKTSDYVSVIESDSMLALRVMRVANSEFFGFSRKVENLTQALNLIGIMQIHDVLLCSLCMRAFSSIPSEVLNLKAFWLYSTQCGIASRVIAQYSFSPIINHFFTLGLIHEIGHAAMYSKVPELSFQVLEDSQTQNRSIEELEREYFGFDYGQLSKSLLELWKLPETYQQVANFHLHPKLADSKFSYEVQVINLAHSICQNLTAGLQPELIASARVKVAQLKHLPPNIDEIILNEINAHAESVLSMLWPVDSHQISSQIKSQGYKQG